MYARVHACKNGTFSFHPSYNTFTTRPKMCGKIRVREETEKKTSKNRVSECVKIWWHIICKVNIFEKFICELDGGRFCICQNEKGVFGLILKQQQSQRIKKNIALSNL